MSNKPAVLPDPPEILANRYLVGKLIGEGGSGAVFLVRDRTSGQRLAVKIREARDQQMPLRFIAEANAMARLRHPRLVHVVDSGNEGKLYWYTMPYYPGGSLRQWVKTNGGVEPRQALDWAFQILEGLDAVHKAGLVHRDVKPHNVLLDDASQVLLTDFGLIRHLEGGVPYRTRTDQSMGTPNYRAPEQAEDAANVDHRADLYGVGATLYFVITGKRPGFLYMVADDDPEMHAVPEQLRGFILRCMAFSPDERFVDARSCAAEVARLRDQLDPEKRVLAGTWMARFDRGGRQGLWQRLMSWIPGMS